MSKGNYVMLECGCHSSENGFIPNGDCKEHGTMYDVPVKIIHLTSDDYERIFTE